MSANLANINASVTSKAGVPSNITMSKVFFNFSNISSVFSDANNSDGFGGTFPEGIIYKLSISVVVTYFSMSIFSLFHLLQIDNLIVLVLNLQKTLLLICLFSYLHQLIQLFCLLVQKLQLS